ncbi:MAG: cytochrome c biogenesis protein CcdA, partial [Halobacteriaceae archaeon]
MGFLADTAATFLTGLATPLGAVCVLPLYPGFLAYLSNQEGDVSVARLGLLVTAGVLLFMGLLGVVFSTLLQTSLTRVIGVVSPIAFGLLAGLGLLLLADVDVGKWFPSVDPPQSEYPRLTALGYGFFFGAIIIPCNPAFVALFFARALLFADPVASLAQFLA